MKSYHYIDNTQSKIIFCTQANSITEADTALEASLGISPIKTPHIGCVIHPGLDLESLLVFVTSRFSIVINNNGKQFSVRAHGKNGFSHTTVGSDLFDALLGLNDKLNTEIANKRIAEAVKEALRKRIETLVAKGVKEDREKDKKIRKVAGVLYSGLTHRPNRDTKLKVRPDEAGTWKVSREDFEADISSHTFWAEEGSYCTADGEVPALVFKSGSRPFSILGYITHDNYEPNAWYVISGDREHEGH